MTGRKDKVIHLHRRDPQGALTRLNRITGLHFARWPESLLAHAEQDAQVLVEVPPPLPASPGISSG
jgi:hypothetical protein